MNKTIYLKKKNEEKINEIMEKFNCNFNKAVNIMIDIAYSKLIDMPIEDFYNISNNYEKRQ